MRDNLTRLFERLQPIDPPAQLYHTILMAIAMKRRRSARIYLATSILTGSLSVAALLPALSYLYRSIVESGLIRYLSLLVSDSDVATTYWHEFGFTIIEALPILALLGVLTAFLTLCISITTTKSHLRAAFSH